MASSGSNTYTHSSGMYIRLEWRIADTNIANNRTKISYDVYIGYQYRMSSSATKNANITVDGVSTNFTFSIGNYTSGWEKHLVVANEKWISHNTDGTKSTSLSAWADVQVSAGGYYVNRLSVSLTANLDPIPRTSTMTGSSSVNAGGTYSYTVSPASSSFSHTLTFSIGSKTSTVTAANGAGTWTVPASWAEALPTKTSGVMNVVLTTKNGTTTVGTRSYTTTLLVPSSMVPSVGSLSIAKHSSTPSPANGSSWPYVQNITTAYASVSGASGSYGSTISSYTIKAGGTTRYASSGTFPLPSAGNITFTATVKDSRGRTASTTSTLTVVAYSPPRITGVTLTRTNSSGVADNAGTYAKVVPTFTKTSIMDGTTQLNNYNTTGTIVRYRKVGSSTWTSGGTVTSGATRIFGGGTLSPDASYEVEVIVKDQLSTATWGGQIGTEFVTLDLLESGTGIAVGKVATEANTFDSALKIRARNAVVGDDTSLVLHNGTGASSITIKSTDIELHAGSNAINLRGASNTSVISVGTNVALNAGSNDVTVAGNAMRITPSNVYLSTSLPKSAWGPSANVEPLFMDSSGKLYRWDNSMVPHKECVGSTNIASGTSWAAGGIVDVSISHTLGVVPRAAIAVLTNRPGGSSYLVPRAHSVSSTSISVSVYNTLKDSSTLISGSLGVQVVAFA